MGVYDGRMKRTNIHLTEQQLKNLAAETKRTGVPMAEIIRRLVDAHFSKGKKNG